MDKLVEDTFAAIDRGDNVKLEGLLKPVFFGLFKGVNPNSSRDDGITFLMEAAVNGNLEICKLLFEKVFVPRGNSTECVTFLRVFQ